MVTFLVILEQYKNDYYYRYISEDINYYLPFYSLDRINEPLSKFINGQTYENSVYKFLEVTNEKNINTESFTTIQSDKRVSITLRGYKYNNWVIIVGTQKSDNLLEDILFKEDYIFLIKWLDSKQDLIENISDNIVSLLEYTKEEILLKPYIDFIYHEDKDYFKKELDKYVSSNTLSFYQRYRLVSKSNKVITVLDHSCQIIRDGKKHLISYLRDISTEILMSNKLKELIALDEVNFNNSILIKIEWDEEFKITRWNSEANNILGWGEEIVGKGIQEIKLFSNEDSIKMQAQFKRLFAHEVDNVISSYTVEKKHGGLVNTKWSNKLIYRDGKSRILSSIIDQSQEVLLTTRLDEMENRTDLLLKTLSETKMSNDVFAKLIHNPLTANPEGLIKAEIIIRKLEEEITRLNNTIFYNNDNNLLNDVAFLKNEDYVFREKLNKIEEDNKKLNGQIDNLLNINILTAIKNINSKNILTFIVIGYIIFGQILPSIYPTIIRPSINQINKELKRVEGKD